MRILAHDVAAFVAKRAGLTFHDLCCQRRSRAYARPRQIAMYLIRELCPHMSYPAIGRMLGWRDHTTILHGVRNVASLIPTNEEVAAEVVAGLSFFRQADNELDAQIVEAAGHLGSLILLRRRASQEAAA